MCARPSLAVRSTSRPFMLPAEDYPPLRSHAEIELLSGEPSTRRARCPAMSASRSPGEPGGSRSVRDRWPCGAAATAMPPLIGASRSPISPVPPALRGAVRGGDRVEGVDAVDDGAQGPAPDVARKVREQLAARVPAEEADAARAEGLRQISDEAPGGAGLPLVASRG